MVCGGGLWGWSVVVVCGGHLWWWSVVVVCGGGLWWWSVVVICGGGSVVVYGCRGGGFSNGVVVVQWQ